MSHTCGRNCVCPLHKTPAYFNLSTGEHACQDPECRFAHGYWETPLTVNFSGRSVGRAWTYRDKRGEYSTEARVTDNETLRMLTDAYPLYSIGEKEGRHEGQQGHLTARVAETGQQIKVLRSVWETREVPHAERIAEIMDFLDRSERRKAERMITGIEQGEARAMLDQAIMDERL